MFLFSKSIVLLAFALLTLSGIEAKISGRVRQRLPSFIIQPVPTPPASSSPPPAPVPTTASPPSIDPNDPTSCEKVKGTIRVRKSWGDSDFTRADKELYLDAFSRLNELGVHSIFVLLHYTFNPGSAASHGKPPFFTWHRVYLIALENALRLSDPRFACVTLPYWNSGLERSACGSQCTLGRTHPILVDTARQGQRQGSVTLCQYGGNCGIQGVCASDERAFMAGNTQHPTSYGDICGVQGSNGCLVRQNLQSESQVQQLSAWQNALNDRNYESFRATTETALHAPVHVQVGGHMLTMCSPADPVFFSHHAFVDKMFFVWQFLHGQLDNPGAYSDRQGGTTIDSELLFLLPTQRGSQPNLQPALLINGGPSYDLFRRAWPKDSDGKPMSTARQIWNPLKLGPYSYTYSVDELDKLRASQTATAPSMVLEASAGSSGLSDNDVILRIIATYTAIKKAICDRLQSEDWQSFLSKYSTLKGITDRTCSGWEMEKLIWSEMRNEECWAQYHAIENGKLVEKTCSLNLDIFREHFLLADDIGRNQTTNECCGVIEKLRTGMLRLLDHTGERPAAVAVLAAKSEKEEIDAYLREKVMNLLEENEKKLGLPTDDSATSVIQRRRGTK